MGPARSSQLLRLTAILLLGPALAACGERTANGDAATTADDGTGTTAGDSGGETGGETGGACPAGGCLDLDDGTLPGDGLGELVVAFGDGAGSFDDGTVFSHGGAGLVGFRDAAGGAGLATWENGQLCVVDLESRLLAVAGCVDVGNVIDVVAFQADDDAEQELLVAADGDPLVLVEVTNGTPAATELSEIWSATEYAGSAAADFDADGHDEVLLAGLTGDCVLDACVITTTWVDLDGSPVMTPVQHLGRPIAGRFDDDGIVDLFIGDRFYTGLGTKLPTEGLHALSDYTIDTYAATASLDGDTRDELVMGGGINQNLTVLDAPLSLTGADLIEVPGVRGQHLRVGDLQGDGIDEIVSLEPLDPNNAYGALMVQVTRLAPDSATAADAMMCATCEPSRSSSATALADFDGDGNLDYAAVVRQPN